MANIGSSQVYRIKRFEIKLLKVINNLSSASEQKCSRKTNWLESKINALKLIRRLFFNGNKSWKRLKEELRMENRDLRDWDTRPNIHTANGGQVSFEFSQYFNFTSCGNYFKIPFRNTSEAQANIPAINLLGMTMLDQFYCRFHLHYPRNGAWLNDTDAELGLIKSIRNLFSMGEEVNCWSSLCFASCGR